MNICFLTALILMLKLVNPISVIQMPFYKQRKLELLQFTIPNLGLPLRPLTPQRCFVTNILTKCPVISNYMINNLGLNKHNILEEQSHQYDSGRSANENFEAPYYANDRTHLKTQHFSSINIRDEYVLSKPPGRMLAASSKLNLKLNNPLQNNNGTRLTVPNRGVLKRTLKSPIAGTWSVSPITVTTTAAPPSTTTVAPDVFGLDHALDAFERKFHATTFDKLSSITPASRRENGMSFVQSGLFLQLALMTFLTESDKETTKEIENCLGYSISEKERFEIINATMSSLPVSSDGLKFRLATRLVLRKPERVSQRFRSLAAPAMNLIVNGFNDSATADDIAAAINEMVEKDSGGAIHDTFEGEDFIDGVEGILLTTMYFRSRWRSSPTLLNGTHRFRDSDKAPQRTVRMIRINDIMRYANLTDWDAEALEIFYSTAGLSLLIYVPRGNSLRSLVNHAANTTVEDIEAKMNTVRASVTLPLYTLRMTLLLPNKLEAMGITHLLDTKSAAHSDMFRLSHAVQRIMFWAEAGRNAFKDDGLEWDETPTREVIIDRPYIFYVRWKNKTLLSGNFVL